MDQANCNLKKKKWKQLTENKRYQIESLLQAGHSCREIAKQIGFSVRTIQREKKRGLVALRKPNPSYNKYEDDYIIQYTYCADYAQRDYKVKASNKGPKLKLSNCDVLMYYLKKEGSKKHFSPKAALGRFKKEYKEAETVSHQTIYNYIYSNIIKSYPLWKGRRKKPKNKAIKRPSWRNPRGVSIEDRPEIIEQRSTFGHWEIDCVIGKQTKGKVILTLTERKTRYCIFEIIDDKSQASVKAGLERIMRRLSKKHQNVFQTITADNGLEFACAKDIKQVLKAEEVYYAHPYSSYERGTNENCNGMIRRFLKKGTSFDKLSKKKLKEIENWVNNYPRKILDYATAKELFQMMVS